ncbi:tegument protein UL7 [macacine betaherpesvirus 9]|uniref:Tegument protein UL7 n=1 Tax=macacine betaherpesvirus 9 TaxID=2560568 RepID=A0A191S3V7_9BETA|nr:tegument protein UL7 [macacine betaherpesvirus 9]ANC96579.1 tegument protein UL7 [macacine betaherpesvirus 9]
MELTTNLKESKIVDIFNILSVRNIYELNKDNEKICLKNLSIIDLSVGDSNIWFHIENGTIINGKTYKNICDKTFGYMGFIGLVLLDSEDTLEEIRLDRVQFKRRVIHLFVQDEMEFLLCGLIYALENLPIKGQTLLNLRTVLSEMKITSLLSRLLFQTCKKIISILRYVFFDDKCSEILKDVPLIIQLYHESTTANIQIFNLYFNSKKDQKHILSLNTKHLQNESVCIKDLINDIINNQEIQKQLYLTCL